MTFWEFISKLDTIWKPFGHHFGVKNLLKSLNIAIPRGNKKLPDFDIVFYWILGAKLNAKNTKKRYKKTFKNGLLKKQFPRRSPALLGATQRSSEVW